MKVAAQNLTMRYHDAGRVIEVFRGVNLDVQSGTKLAVTGESGVGKTTLLYLLGGLEQPTAGEVTIGERCITKDFQANDSLTQFRGKHVGFIFQFHHLLPEFDAVENAAMPLFIQGVPPNVARTRATELLRRVGLIDRLGSRPGTLSGGEQQRVAIARALATNPGVLLADEPTGNLDQRTAAEVHRLLLEIHRDQKMTFIIVTHSTELARMMDTVLELTPNGLVKR